MVDFNKRRVSPEAAKNGQWFEDPEGFRGIAVKITGLNTDACIKVRSGVLEAMFGAADADVEKYPGLTQYLVARILLDAAVKDIRGLTNDMGHAVPYSRDYLAGILLKDQAADAKPKTPDGKEYDASASLIYGMLTGLGLKAEKILLGEEKKEPPASFAGGEGKPSASMTGGTTEGEATQSGSAKAKAKN